MISKNMKFNLWLESTSSELFKSSVEAFPNTNKRQHAIDEISIQDVRITPFKGVKTLLFRANSINTENNNEYNTLILFKNIKENEIPSLEQNDILIRCNCPDFYWRFNYYNHLDNSLYGKKRKKYDGHLWEANPKKLPGLCKHIIKFLVELKNNDLIHD